MPRYTAQTDMNMQNVFYYTVAYRISNLSILLMAVLSHNLTIQCWKF
jgi:hypothetical protein